MGFLDTIKGWFTSAKDKVGDMERDAVDQAKDIAGGVDDRLSDMERDAVDQAKDIAGGIKDKFDGGGADEGDDGGA
ncbi:MAG: hypothetical protein V3U46_12010 [Acidimicrobiia bacterium]